MLIQALDNYYRMLAKDGKVIPDGYSNVKIHYLVSLREDGTVDEVIRYQDLQELETKAGKRKEQWVPKIEKMPQRTEKPGIDANIIEHRPLYLFGLNFDKDMLTPDDRTDKAKKSHEAFVQANLAFLEGLDSPVVCAYRNFIQNWRPQDETQNACLLGIGKDYGKSGFAFCMSGFPDQLLHMDDQIKQKWEQQYEKAAGTHETVLAQCAVSGEEAPIARIHNKIRGISGGAAGGNVLVSYKNTAENSYCQEQSYNSNISEPVMKRYTEALNYLLTGKKHNILLDDVTIVFWATHPDEACEDALMAMLYGRTDQMDADQTERMIKQLLTDGSKGKLTVARLQGMGHIQEDVEFYMVGLKPNSARLAVQFIYRRQYADVLWNIARFQQDLQISQHMHPVSIGRIKMELLSPKSKNEKLNPALLTKLFEAAIYGRKYPAALLETVVCRVKTDVGSKFNDVRAGIIKACLNRNYEEEEIKVALDQENYAPAYLCGRLFAVLEGLQQAASTYSLNRTIKDAYFASAASNPAMVFPKLLKLAQNHLNKVDSPGLFNKRIREIVDKLGGGFPGILSLPDQGRFMIGYYQQTQYFIENSQKAKEKHVQRKEIQDGAEWNGGKGDGIEENGIEENRVEMN